MSNFDAFVRSKPLLLETGSGLKQPFIVSARSCWHRPIVGAVLAATEFAAASVTILASNLALRALGIVTTPLLPINVLLPGMVIAMLHHILGLDDSFRSSQVEVFRVRLLAAAIGAAVFTATLPTLSLAVLIAFWPTMAVLFVVAGAAAAATVREALISLDLWKIPALLVGTAAATENLAATLSTDRSAAFTPVGRFSIESQSQDCATPVVSCPPEAVLLISSGNLDDDLRIASRFDLPTITIVHSANTLSALWLHPRAIGNLFGIDLKHGGLRYADRLMKRIIDLAFAIPAAIVLLPVVLVLSAAIWSIDHGNPFYYQVREGLGGHPIKVWKLRSMHRDADFRLERLLMADPAMRSEWEAHFKLRQDPRILPRLGNFIRRTSLDELPQLWNILRGDMSLVGPRPFPGYHLAAFDAEFLALRASVMPGLTGVWQISARSDGDLDTQRHLDSYYVRNWSIWLDLFVLIKTLPAVISARGAR